MTPASSPSAFDDRSIGWLRALLAISVLAPAVVFVASSWLDYRQTVELATQRVDRAVRIASEHAMRVLETGQLVLGRVGDLVAGRGVDALRADEPALHERLRAIVRATPQVEDIFVLDDAGAPIASARRFPAADSSAAAPPYSGYLAAGPGSVLATAVRDARPTAGPRFIVSRRHESPGSFAGVIGVSLYPDELTRLYRELVREHPGVQLLLYRRDGTPIMRYPEEGTPARLAADTPWMRLARAGDAAAVHVEPGTDGRSSLVAVRELGAYPLYLGSSLSFHVIEREWVDKALVTLGFALAAMLALGAASVMALRRTLDQREVTRQWQEEVARRGRAETALRESQRMETMGQLTGGVAHDFNNLLMVVNGNLQILRRRLGPSMHDRQLEAIGNAIQRGVRLTRHLLAFSRRQALQPRSLDLAELMPGVAEMLSHSLRDNIRLDCHVNPGTWPIKADSAELELALLNVAVNARDAMPAGGVLTIRARNATVEDLLLLGNEMTGDYVLIALHDEGEGIPPAVLNRVFEPFFTTKAPGKGTGLGLSQVYGFTRQSGGTVTLQSPPGKGTTITLWLPRSMDAPVPRAPPRELPVSHGRGSILLAEDDASVATVLRELLEHLGYAVTVARSGTDALSQLDSGGVFDLLLTDVVMTGPVNGLELARRARERTNRLSILVMTGYAAEIARITSEGYTVLTKPFDLETLAQAIERKIGGEAVLRP